jgi:type I restriction enzyme M protein
MLSPQLRRKVHDLWSLFWSSGLSNPLVAIEQITYLLFIRQLESLDRDRVKSGKVSIYSKLESDPPDVDAEKCRWSYIRQNPSFQLLNEVVFPWLRNLENRVSTAQNGETTLGKISNRLSDAYFILDPNKSETLKRSVGLIDDLFKQLDTRSVNSDIMGDIFEYLLEEVKESGKNGQFRTPRHIIRFMVELLKPELGKRVLDPACGSGGFLLNTLLYWRAKYTDPEVLRLEWDGTPHNMHPVWPEGVDIDFSKLFHGYDNDRTMVRIAWMNLILHGLEAPEVYQLDSLSQRLEDNESGTYDYILANPPFTGSVDESDLSKKLNRFPTSGKNTALTTKSELLFVWLMLDLLKIGGRAAVIVPDGVLFGSTNAHRALRRQLLFENTLEAVISLPANMFQPYSGVKTSILLFQKAGENIVPGADPRTNAVWFYEITNEAYSLDQKRKALFGQDNDIWDASEKFYSETKSTSQDYYQPDYWEERWRSVDNDFLKIFPDKSIDKGHHYPLHELWPEDFPFDNADKRGSRQYDEAVLANVQPQFEEVFRQLTQQTVAYIYSNTTKPDEEKARTIAEKKVRDLISQLNKKVKEDGILDREFDQFGHKALQTVFKEINANVSLWVGEVAVPVEKPKTSSSDPSVDIFAKMLFPLLIEFAKLDGYNVRCSSLNRTNREGKLVPADDGKTKRQKTLLSWVVPVRRWAERESWGEDPETHETIAEPTHEDGIVRPDYLAWLRDTLNVFDNDATVKKEFLNRLDPDCLEALDFNLSAGRHKPFIFDAGEHRPPAELIGELQAIHSEIQERLAKLLAMVGGKE